jgi:electron transfer flavoprotein alpha subunit
MKNQGADDMSENKGILVYCETAGGKLAPIAAELLGAGSRLLTASGGELCAVLIGSGIGGPAREAIECGAQKVYVVDEPSLKDYTTESYLIVLEKIVRQAAPEIVLLGQTAAGRDLAPWLAFHLNTGATMDCTALEIDPAGKRLLMTRPVYGGNAQAVQVCSANPQIATVRAKAMAPAIKDNTRQGQVFNVAAGIDPAALKTRVIERKVETAAGVKLEEARVVVSGGRGMGSAAGFKQLEEIAGILKGAVGATRPPCDKKWIADTQQIGLTGKVVSPDLYIAVGLSGASQHLSGFSSSKVIVAINKDPEANIFKVAHYGIIGDWKSVLPAFAARLKEAAG